MKLFAYMYMVKNGWHSRGQRFDPAYLHQTKAAEAFGNHLFSKENR